MTSPSPASATYADLAAVPDNLVAEIIFGQLVTQPRPAPRHGAAANGLGTLVTETFQYGRGGPGGWVFIVEPELHFGPHVVVPDLAGWRRERLLGAVDKAFIAVAPDWVCEVLSPSTERVDRRDKTRIYAAYGVSSLWFVNPLLQTLEVLRRQDERTWLLLGTFSGDEAVSAAPFDAITFQLGQLWPFDEPRSGSADSTN